MPANLENSSMATRLEKSVFIPIPKNVPVVLISHASKVMLRILQARLQQFVNQELPDVQVGFRKDRGTKDQIANICWTREKAKEFQKNIYFCFSDYAKSLWQRWEYQTTLPVSWETRSRKKQQLELDMEWQTGSKWRKKYDKGINGYPAHLTLMWKLQSMGPQSWTWLSD